MNGEITHGCYRSLTSVLCGRVGVADALAG
jgi:hypothetical protein